MWTWCVTELFVTVIFKRSVFIVSLISLFTIFMICYQFHVYTISSDDEQLFTYLLPQQQLLTLVRIRSTWCVVQTVTYACTDQKYMVRHTNSYLHLSGSEVHGASYKQLLTLVLIRSTPCVVQTVTYACPEQKYMVRRTNSYKRLYA